MESYSMLSFETDDLDRLHNKRQWKVIYRLCDVEKW